MKETDGFFFLYLLLFNRSTINDQHIRTNKYILNNDLTLTMNMLLSSVDRHSIIDIEIITCCEMCVLMSLGLLLYTKLSLNNK
jgi:hypothetical protein